MRDKVTVPPQIFWFYKNVLCRETENSGMFPYVVEFKLLSIIPNHEPNFLRTIVEF